MKKSVSIWVAVVLLCMCPPGLAGVPVSGRGELPIVSTPVTLTLGIQQDPRIPSYEAEDNDFTRFLEERTGIALEFMVLPAQDTQAKIKLMFASDDLPDVILGESLIDDASIYDYGDQGMLLPLNDYIAQYGENFDAMLENCSNEFMLPLLTSPDGNIYSLPTYVEEYHGIYQERCWIYKPWLDAVGLDMPTTIDEFTEVLRAFRDNDPNGNGEKDEIPLMYYNDTKYMVRFFMNSFLPFDYMDEMVVQDGVVSPAYFEAAFKQGIEWMHLLAEEGLLDPASFTQDQDSVKAVLNMETPVIGVYPHPWMDGYYMDPISERRINYAFMPALEGPQGVRYSFPSTPNPNPAFFITYKCENPEAAYRLGDYMLDAEVSRYNRYGVVDRDWKYIDDDTAVGLNGEKAVWEDIEEIWQKTTTNAYWRRRGPHYHPLGTFESLRWDCNPNTYNYMLVQTAQQLDGLAPVEFVPTKLAMNAEETDAYVELRSSIDTYLWENISKLIVGDRDMREWDAFIAEFSSMSIDAFVAAIQSSYTRMLDMK